MRIRTKITKYAKYTTKMFVFEIYVLWIEFVSNQNFNMPFLNKYTNA